MSNSQNPNARPPREIPDRVWGALLDPSQPPVDPEAVGWRVLERRRVALAQLNGTPIRAVNWECEHLAGRTLEINRSLIISSPLRKWSLTRDHRASPRQKENGRA
jgi:hypothetical protein